MLTPPDSQLAALLAGRPMARIRWGLERMQAMMEALGDPHTRFRALHIGGTNGKGSVAATAEACLRAAGYRTGLYTSPHLVGFAERIRVDGAPASAELLEGCATEVRPLARRVDASFFEAATALGFLVFARARVEVAVVEVGLGGRLDATNVIEPRVTAVTGVDMDHAEYLGQSLEAIAVEKAGILKPRTPAVLGPMPGEVAAVFHRRAAELDAAVAVVGREAAVDTLQVDRTGTTFRYRSPRWPEALRLRTPLIGRHQATNAAVALLMLEHFEELPREMVESGLAAVRWPGRFQILEARGCTWVLDAAHNVAGAHALAATLDDVPLPEPRVALLAILGDKDWQEMLVPILSRVHSAVFTLAPSAPAERAWDPAAARVAIPGRRVELERDFEAALERSRVLAEGGSVLVTGSCHTVGDALARLGGGGSSDAWTVLRPDVTLVERARARTAEGRRYGLRTGSEAMRYDPRLVQPMREELTRLGVRELRTADEVDGALQEKGTTLVVVNSVCGCAAGNARPAVSLALQHECLPDHTVTVFAGMDVEATTRAREYFTGYRPSSPSIALLADGELVFMLERHQIEGRMPPEIARDLTGAFDRFCRAAV